jgi:hypothetical protein
MSEPASILALRAEALAGQAETDSPRPACGRKTAMMPVPGSSSRTRRASAAMASAEFMFMFMFTAPILAMPRGLTTSGCSNIYISRRAT